MKNFEKSLTLLSCIITISNLYLAFPSIIKPELVYINFDSMKLNLATRVVILIILELSLASVFGFLYKFFTDKYISSKNFFPSYIITISITALLSAWISIFNLEYFLIKESLEGFWDFFGFFFLILAAYGIAFIFIIQHILNLISKIKDELKHKKDNQLNAKEKIRMNFLKRQDKYFIEESIGMLPVIFQGVAFIIIYVCIIIES